MSREIQALEKVLCKELEKKKSHELPLTLCAEKVKMSSWILLSKSKSFTKIFRTYRRRADGQIINVLKI
uniref:hypothetical protein n=1 Tax=Enterococcus faecalis TaxID=1351 RepID=UPI00359C2FBB